MDKNIFIINIVLIILMLLATIFNQTNLLIFCGFVFLKEN